MYKLFTFLLFLASAATCIAQVNKLDSIYRFNGEPIGCKVIHLSISEVVFSYPNEELTNTLPAIQINKIKFASGRIQKITEKVLIQSAQDWQKVQITSLPGDVLGLIRLGEVKGKSSGSTISNMSSVKERAEEDIKRQAARLGAHVILLQIYNSRDNEMGKTLAKATINGVAYGYEGVLNDEERKTNSDKPLRDGPIEVSKHTDEFEIGEKVIVKIGSDLYEGIITKIKANGAIVKYLEGGKEKEAYRWFSNLEKIK